ncbi:MAG TPA: NUDIX domain-containing protein [Thermaerobacter sp.]
MGATGFRASIECWILRPGPEGVRVLLLHVPSRPGGPRAFWQPITGGIRQGETPLEACLREVREETGLVLAAQDLRLIHPAWEWDVPGPRPRKTIVAAAMRQGVVRVAPYEHDDGRWVKGDEVERWLYWESNRRTWPVVRRALLG